MNSASADYILANGAHLGGVFVISSGDLCGGLQYGQVYFIVGFFVAKEIESVLQPATMKRLEELTPGGVVGGSS